MPLFVTHFNQRYLSRGLAMARSLLQVDADARLCVICLDQETHDVFRHLRISRLTPIPPTEFETPELLAMKAERTVAEYCWTCTPHAIEYALTTFPEADSATYLDADLFFFSSPEPVFQEMGESSVLITPHRFVRDISRMEQVNGIYNVQYLTFKRDDHGLAVLAWWRERCDEWCYDRHEADRYGDQKYLDRWPETFPGVHPLANPRLCLAPWNLSAHAIEKQDGTVLADGQDPLAFFHFQSLKIHAMDRFTLAVDYRLRPEDLKCLYHPYLRSLQQAMMEAQAMGHQPEVEFSAEETPGTMTSLKRFKRKLLGKENCIIFP